MISIVVPSHAIACHRKAVIAAAGPYNLRSTYGGPAPFGVGLGVLKFDEQQTAAPLPPTPAEAERDARRAHRQRLKKLARQFWAPTDGLTPEEEQHVQEERLRALLGSFWDLMHEAARPWHRAAVIHLCCELPGPVRKRYRAVKASTMQQLLADRAKAERQLHISAELLLQCSRQLQKWRRLGQDPAGPQAASWQERLKAEIRALGHARKHLIAMAQHARSGFQDVDYEQYIQLSILPVAEELMTGARQQLHVLGGDGWEDRDAEDEEDADRQHRDERILPRQRGGAWSTGWQQQAHRLQLETYKQAQWRYPPMEYVVLKRRNVMAAPLAVSIQAAPDHRSSPL